jgi:small GTP-binding protein
MPANLPPQYFETEKKLKTAKTAEEKVAILEELLAIVPKHKGTEKMRALFKTKIAKLKSQTQKKPGALRHKSTYLIDKAGAGQVILIGLPNSGKSSLIKSLTNAQPEIGDYPFTTHSPSPAMMRYENIQIQLVDTPPITTDYMEAWHSELIKGADGVLVILDLSDTDPALDFLVLLEKLTEKRIELAPASLDIPAEKKMFQKNALIIGNKEDLPQAEKNLIELKSSLSEEFDLISVSADQEDHVDELRNKIFLLLNVLRVYSKIPGKKADHNEPFVLKKGSTLMDMAKSVHKDFYQKLRFARIWGKDKYQGQKVNRDYILQDEDIIELHI